MAPGGRGPGGEGYTGRVFEVSIQREFCAAHAITIRGVREALHGHNWRVTARVRGSALDEDGLLVDFHQLERLLNDTVGRLDTTNLNETAPFDQLNPTAELVALHIMDELRRGLEAGASKVEVSSVSVTEAPGCVATVRREFT